MNFVNLYYLGLVLAIFGTIGAFYCAFDDEDTLGRVAPKRWVAALGFAIMAFVLWAHGWVWLDPVSSWAWRIILLLMAIVFVLPEITRVVKALYARTYPTLK